MTKRDVLSVACKILGLTCILYVILAAPGIVGFIPWAFEQVRRGSSGSMPDLTPFYQLAALVGGALLWLVAAYVLLRFGDAIAARLVRVDAPLPSVGTSEWEKPVFVMAARIVGLACLARGIPVLARPLAAMAFQVTYRPGGNMDTWAGLISGTALLAFGAYLLSGGKHLVQFAFRGETTSPEGRTK